MTGTRTKGLTRRSSLGGLGFAAAAGALTGGRIRPLKAQAPDELTIGGVGSLSGGGTNWGLAIQRGALMAIDEVNKAGGLKVGEKTWRVAHKMYDDQYTAQGGATAATRLVNEDKVKYIVGPISSAATLAVLGVSQPAKVIVMSGGYALGVMKNAFNAEYNFRVHNTPPEFMPALIAWLGKTYPAKKRISFLAGNDATGQSVVPQLTKTYDAAGLTVAYTDFFERGTREFTPLLRRAIAAKIDIFDLDGNTPADSGLMVRQIRQAGYRGLIIQAGGPAVEQIIEIAGPLAEGFQSYDMLDFNSDRGKKFAAQYRAMGWTGIIDAQTGVFYTATKVLFEAMRRSGSIDPDVLKNVIPTIENFDSGIYGRVSWGGKREYGVNHQMLSPFYISEVKDGKIVSAAELFPPEG
jgi:branched-chain amino acid transport system substrate-binding protein